MQGPMILPGNIPGAGQWFPVFLYRLLEVIHLIRHFLQFTHSFIVDAVSRFYLAQELIDH